MCQTAAVSLAALLVERLLGLAERACRAVLRCSSLPHAGLGLLGRGRTAGSWAAFRMGSSSVWLLSCRYSGSRVRAADSSQASVASRMLRFLLGSRSIALLTALTLALRPCSVTRRCQP